MVERYWSEMKRLGSTTASSKSRVVNRRPTPVKSGPTTPPRPAIRWHLKQPVAENNSSPRAKSCPLVAVETESHSLSTVQLRTGLRRFGAGGNDSARFSTNSSPSASFSAGNRLAIASLRMVPVKPSNDWSPPYCEARRNQLKYARRSGRVQPF